MATAPTESLSTSTSFVNIVDTNTEVDTAIRRGYVRGVDVPARRRPGGWPTTVEEGVSIMAGKGEEHGVVRVRVESTDGNFEHPFRVTQTVSELKAFAYNRLVEDKGSVPLSA